MKSIITSIFLVLTLFVVAPQIGNGEEVDVSDSRIESLLLIIENLQQQLVNLKEKYAVKRPDVTIIPPADDPRIYCPPFERTLQKGSTGDDVGDLQEFLRSTGDYSYSEITSYYGPLTETAVQNFQKRAGVVSYGDAFTTGFGMFGPMTNKAMYRYCTFPDPIECTDEYAPVCGQPTMPTCPEGLACAQVMPDQQTYSNKCHLKSAGATFLYEGQCRVDKDPTIPNDCKVWYDGCNTCSRSEPNGDMACTLRYCFAPGTPSCKEYFSDDNNKPPVISSFSGPTILEAGEKGTWKIQASDPEGESLSYHVNWGDVILYDSLSESSGALEDFIQTTTFEHSYEKDGVYTVTITVKDEGGDSVRTSSTVRVTTDTGPVACIDLYDPVCGRPAGCEDACGDSGLFCAAMCKLNEPKTYSNKCYLEAEKATFLYKGACENVESTYLQ